MTFGQWRQQARLLRALELLATGEKVIDIVLALGYESPSAFATMFRKQFDRTPSQFFATLHQAATVESSPPSAALRSKSVQASNYRRCGHESAERIP